MFVWPKLTFIQSWTFERPKFCLLFNHSRQKADISLRGMIFFWVLCRNTSPHTICIFICHCLEMYYYFTLTAARTLIVQTIFDDVCLFLIISCHESCNIVHLPIWNQFNCSSTCMRLCLYFTNMSQICNCFFPPCLCFAFAITPLWAVFFLHFSNFGRIHLKFLLPFQINKLLNKLL